MKKATKIYLSVLFLLILKLNAQILNIPFQSVDNKYILLKFPLEKSKDSITFFFDTGATTTLLDKNFAIKNNLKPNHTQEVSGASGKKNYEMLIGQKIHLSASEKLENVNIVFEDLSRLQKSLGENFDGIIGNDLLKKYITKIDFENKKIILYNKIDQINVEGYTKVEFKFKKNIPIPQFPINIELYDGTKYSGDIFFDSGASGISLLMNEPFNTENKIENKLPKTIKSESKNLSGNTTITISKIKSLKISNYTFNELPFSISSDKQGVSSYSNYLGILGSEIINRFNLIIDYGSKNLYLKPNNFFKNEFEFPISPIKIEKSDNKIVVSSVISDSDAEIKGLRSGMQILSINGIKGASLQTYRNLLRQEGKKVKIKFIDENNITKVIKLKLKKLL